MATADPAQLGAVVAALAECEAFGDPNSLALLLLREGHPAEEVKSTARMIGCKPGVRYPRGYLCNTLRNRRAAGYPPLPHLVGDELSEDERRRMYERPQAQPQPQPDPPADSLGEEQPAAVDTKSATVSFLPDPTEAPALEAVTAALAHARRPTAATEAAQLLTDWRHLQPALIVAAIEAEAAASRPKPPSLMGIKNRLRQLNATEAR